MLAGRYRIEGLLGEGGMARVYRARHVRIGKIFALKLLAAGAADQRSTRIRFAQEARALARLCHPNVVSACDFARAEDGSPFLVMEYVEGPSLREVLAAEGPLPQRRVLGLVRGLCEGLAHVHRQGLVHRDLKPENVVLEGAEGAPRILDFGIAFSPEGGDCGERVTTEDTVVGTPDYLAPEQAYGRSIDHRADLFALGLLAYEMLAGVAPFGGTAAEVARQNALAKPPPIEARAPGVRVSPELEAIVLRLLEKKPERRYPDAEAVLEALGRVEREARARAGTTDRIAARRRSGARAIAGDALAAAAAVVVLALPWAVGGEGGALGPAVFEVAARGQEPRPSLLARLPLPANDSRTDVESGSPDVEVPAPDRSPSEAPAPVASDPASPSTEAAATSPSTEAAARDSRTDRPRRPRQSRPPERTVSRTATHTAGAREVASERVARRYERVGESIARLEERFGSERTADLRQRFFALPYSEALATPALRGRLIAGLQRIERETEVRRRELAATPRAR